MDQKQNFGLYVVVLVQQQNSSLQSWTAGSSLLAENKFFI